MGSDILTTIRAAVRAALADTGTIFTTAVVDQAIFDVVSDISRLAPREMFEVITLDNLDVSDSELTSADDAWVYIRNATDGIAPTVTGDTPLPLDRSKPPVVKSDGGATIYTENTDYVVDYVLGRIKILSGGAIADAVILDVDYTKSRLAFDISTLTDLINIERLQWMRASQELQFESFHQWENIVWLTSRNGSSQAMLSENDQLYVWYRAEHTKPGAAAGSYPAYMDDVVVKGAVAYALFGKARERELQSITDVASSRTALALADDDHAVIDTLITALDSSLSNAKTALDAMDTFADVPFTEADTAYDDARTLIVAASGAIDAALDKVVQHLESDATNPDSAELQLAAGDSLINAVNTGLQAAEMYARYAEAQVSIARGFVEEASVRLSHALGAVEEGNSRLGMANTMVNVALAHIQTAEGRLGELDRHLALGVLYIQQADGYIAGSDREIQVADRFLLDARERHADYWAHLRDRVESARTGQRNSLKDLPRT